MGAWAHYKQLFHVVTPCQMFGGVIVIPACFSRIPGLPGSSDVASVAPLISPRAVSHRGSAVARAGVTNPRGMRVSAPSCSSV